jgi:hypothetical protein
MDDERHIFWLRGWAGPSNVDYRALTIAARVPLHSMSRSKFLFFFPSPKAVQVDAGTKEGVSLLLLEPEP